MKKDTINLSDTFKIFKKNLKGFYFSIVSGFIIALIGTFINHNYVEKKVNLSSQISIKNPLQNFKVLDLFSLDRIQINKESVSVISTQQKISNYYLMTKEYMELVVNTLDFKKYDIDSKKYGYKMITSKNDTEFKIEFSNVDNPKKIEESLIKMVDDFNKLIKPIIIQNIKVENTLIENYLEISGGGYEAEKLSVLIKIRKELLKDFENKKLEIFTLSSSANFQEISNSRIIIVSFLITLSLFLMFIILKK
tara:strand:- start:721 stop:1473 length:753 start_codon:yes stop_codon:yes gene_type:complete